MLGIGAALILNRFLARVLVGVTPHDTVAFSCAWAFVKKGLLPKRFEECSRLLYCVGLNLRREKSR